MDLIAVGPVLCAARVDGDSRVEVMGKAGLPLVKADDVAAVIVIIGDLRSGYIVAHFRLKSFKSKTAGITVGTDTDVKFRRELQLQKCSEAVRGDGHMICFDSRIKLDQAVFGSVNEKL
jgi:hypothetical protein